MQKEAQRRPRLSIYVQVILSQSSRVPARIAMHRVVRRGRIVLSRRTWSQETRNVFLRTRRNSLSLSKERSRFIATARRKLRKTFSETASRSPARRWRSPRRRKPFYFVDRLTSPIGHDRSPRSSISCLPERGFRNWNSRLPLNASKIERAERKRGGGPRGRKNQTGEASRLFIREKGRKKEEKPRGRMREETEVERQRVLASSFSSL